jgi:hypothetical protein
MFYGPDAVAVSSVAQASQVAARAVLDSHSGTETVSTGHLLVEVTEGGAGTDQPHRYRRFSLNPQLPFHIDCQNPECLYGGFDITPLIREMHNLRELECLRVETCDGVKTLGRRNANYVRCQHLFKVYLKLS